MLGLTRSEAGAQSLAAAGAEVHRGDLEDLDSLRRGAAKADGVIHTAFDHDFSNFVANCEKDRRVIEALGAALDGSDRPLVITSGTGMGSAGPASPRPRTSSTPASEPADRLGTGRRRGAGSGVNVSVMRLPQVHDTVKQGLITPLVAIAREKGVSAYVGDGPQPLSRPRTSPTSPASTGWRWRRPSGRALQRGRRGGYPGPRHRGRHRRGLNVPVVSLSPEEAAGHFGWLAMFAGMDLSASGA